MQVFHTAGLPPKTGSSMRPSIGCRRKRRNALVSTDATNVPARAVSSARGAPLTSGTAPTLSPARLS